MSTNYVVTNFAVSCGLTISQNEPNKIPNIPQKRPIATVLTILKFISKLDDIVISSGLAGNNTPTRIPIATFGTRSICLVKTMGISTI